MNYKEVEEGCLSGLVEKLKETPQDNKFHGEGDVFTHTMLVHKSLDLSGLSERQTSILKISSLLHDIGKIRTTQIAGSDITCPNHSVVGARMAREILWRKFGLVGTENAISFRESIVSLVRYHGFPPHALKDVDGLAKLYRIASMQFLIPDFNLELLYRLSKADMEGRICEDKEGSLHEVDCFHYLTEVEGVLGSTGHLGKDKYSDHKFLGFKTGDCKEPALYDDTWDEVVLMCGLPGTGKDTYIQKNYPGRTIISLDEIRKELKLKPGSDNGKVIQTAKEKAKELLRSKESFVWNATNLGKSTRAQLIDLFEQYRAKTKIIYLETTIENQYKRNHSREEVVPESVIERMINSLVLPEYYEAQEVEWEIV
jgi:predicted kinase